MGHQGRDEGGVCGVPACEKGTRDEWNCHRILQYSQGLIVLAASKTSFFFFLSKIQVLVLDVAEPN